jgi:hypothetical protein
MKILSRKCGRIVAGLLLVGLVSGCASDMNTIVAKPPVNAQKLGHVEGTATGSLLFTFIPIGENLRTKQAYANALAKAPGATALQNVTLQEDWNWWFFGTSKIVTISGEAVK